MSLIKTKLTTTRLCLTPFSEQDANDVFNCITPTLTRYMAWEPPEDKTAFAHIWRQWLINMEQDQEVVFVIREQSTQQFIGLVGLHRIQSDTPELGIWIREDRHGQKYGFEAVNAVFHWGSQQFTFKNFVYPVAEENIPSRKIAENLGGVVVSKAQKPKYHAVTYSIAPLC